MKNSPTQRTLKELKKPGCFTAVVEKWNAWAKIRQDLFGFIDVVHVDPEVDGILGVQATAAPHMLERCRKAMDQPALRAWLMARNQFQVWEWAKRGARGERKLWVKRVMNFAIIGKEIQMTEAERTTSPALAG